MSTRSRILGTLAIALAWAPLMPALAQEGEVIEEIIVTARQQQETLQDVPVTIAALTEADLDRYNITNLVDAAKMVPNMVISPGGSGNGSSLRLRGIGSSSISAAFDHSVAINLDGVVVNRGRFIHNSYMDMGQLEVLKGPQSLYFGKSATAGVVSITTNDPGDEFEMEVSGGYETEFDGIFGEFILSGPPSATAGARLAAGRAKRDGLMENYSADNDPVNVAISGADKYYGDESLNTRLTLVWNPLDNFEAKLKYSYSEYDNHGGGTAYAEEVCPEGKQQPTGVPSAGAPFRLFQGVDDCKLNGNTSKLNLNPGLRNGLPQGYDDGEPGLEQDTHFLSLRMDWDINESFTATSVTGWVDLEHWELDDYSYGASVFGGLHNNIYKSVTQEFRLASDFDAPMNFQAGFFYQDIEQEFDAYQYAFNLGVMPNIFGPAYALVGGDPTATIVGPDPVTGWEYDYNKHHFLDTEVYSVFLAVYWDLNERTEITAGARYTDESKKGRIEIPYLHAAAALFGFGGPPVIEEGLEFDDDNLSPEVAINYYLNDDVSVFLAYKQGFKSGGVDNSALPTAALNPAVNGGDFSFLIYESEEAEGFEAGLKGRFLDSALRFNATAFVYEYSDLQVQLFDSTIIQFSTFNASALETYGVEFDAQLNTNIEGLSLRGAWAWTDTSYSKDFINATGENLKGEDGAGSADITGYIGASYDWNAGGGWRLNLSADGRYTGDYAWSATLDPFKQDSFWVLDAAISLYSEDGRHQFNLIGRNITDEIYAIGGGAIPGRCPNFMNGPAVCNNTGPNSLDQAATTPLGRSLSLQYRYTL
ncbi:MAG: TonB-dependent receptor [Gammaproteobacteria bacterium]|nr:TonB-dependent receptor [Gammaproteobacteria bacterium]